MKKHLPECGTPAYFKAGCICYRLQACKERVLAEVAEAISWVQDLDEALDVITAIREWDTPPPLPETKGVPTSAMWPARGES